MCENSFTNIELVDISHHLSHQTVYRWYQEFELPDAGLDNFREDDKHNTAKYVLDILILLNKANPTLLRRLVEKNVPDCRQSLQRFV